ncbi:hypothetical protein BRADI_1g57990v3 [Brachypodium distachyon]|uniref:Uncharacterized protein n=1 Tax=Brachypodium distachyon TaxID=15368 RepID=A0A2K2DS59_BRADI|nr:hypothetical protein BRADI_1g57990v3 [Brachypodium distachyon]
MNKIQSEGDRHIASGHNFLATQIGGFCVVGSLLGVVKEIDMVAFRNMDVIRVRVGVMDYMKIPSMALLAVDPFVYKIRFVVEQILEIGCPMVGGVLVPRAPDESGSNRRITEMNRDPKRPRSVEVVGHVGTSSGGSDMVMSSQPEGKGDVGNRKLLPLETNLLFKLTMLDLLLMLR